MPTIAEMLAAKKGKKQVVQDSFDDTIKDAVFSVWIVEQGIGFGTDDYMDLMAIPAVERDEIIRSW